MKDKTLIISGASRGIGRAIAIKFASMGYNMLISAHTNRKELEYTYELVKKYGVCCISYLGDLSVYENCKKLFELFFSEYSHLDVLINNAGIAYLGLLQDMEPSDWDRLMGTNLNSVFYCSKLAINPMIRQGAGKIINISSIWGISGAAYEVAYSSSKAAINIFSKSLAKELAMSNIQVNAIACGAIDTDMLSCYDEEEKAAIVAGIASNRLGKSEEVADLAYYLANANSYLTAQVIALDGAFI